MSSQKIIGITGLACMLLIAGLIYWSSNQSTLNAPTLATTSAQLGVNFIRYYWGTDKTADFVQPETIFADYETLGVQAERQMIKADLLWDIVEPNNDEWNFSAADQVIGQAGVDQIVTLFSLQYASPTPPWAAEGEFQSELGDEARDYLTHVIDRYGSTIKYWELGNEMDHWRAADNRDSSRAKTDLELPAAWPEYGFSPVEQGKFLAEVAKFIKEQDFDAVIILPGMSAVTDYTLNTWLTGVLDGAGDSTFDVINYHDYGAWNSMPRRRAQLATFLSARGLEAKPIWLTETGSSSSATLTERTDYPNSPLTQAADLFRRTLPAYAAGDELILWHTYFDSPNSSNNTWRGYGLLDENGQKKPAYYTFQLLSTELLPFTSITAISSTNEQNIYKIVTSTGATKYVAWGSGEYLSPVTGRYANVVPNKEGNFTWHSATKNSKINLTEIPIFLTVDNY